MRRSASILITLSFAAVASIAAGSAASDAVITPTHPALSWMGGPVSGAAPDEFTCVASSCDEFTFRIDVPTSVWRRGDGGVAVRIEWADARDELDLHVYDPRGVDVASSVELHTNVEQALIYRPIPGTYRVLVVGFHALNASYRGTAWIARLGYRSASPDARTNMRFSSPTFVDPQLWTSEPGVWVAGGGSIYTTAIWSLNQGSSMVWRSDDAGRTFRLTPSTIAPGAPDVQFRPCNVSDGGADADVVTDRTGRLYFVDLWVTSNTVGVSTDKGATWTCNPVAASSVQVDRPWLAPAPTADDGPGVDAYMAYVDDGTLAGYVPVAGPVVQSVANHIDVTRDGGKTWQRGVVYALDRVGVGGPIFTADDGTLYQVYSYQSSVWIARSTDEGRTMRLVKVSDRLGSPANLWLAGDVDAAGNVYVAWVEQGSWDVLFSRSTDMGLTWSNPLRVNPPASETSTMPWLAAGRNGDVAIAWYGTGGAAGPNNAPETARWSAWVARTLNGSAKSPRFQTASMSETPVRFGPLCSQGAGCLTDRKMGDFFEIDIARDGAVVATFNDTARIQHTNDGFTPGPYVMAVRQVSGFGMNRNAAAAAEPTGDAERIDGMSEGEVDALDLTALPRAQSMHGSVRLALKLRSAADLTQAVAPTASPPATDAYWVVLWKANDRVEYAGMHVDRDGAVSFYGGDEPVPVGRLDPLQPGLADKLASYPATFALSGHVDPVSGQVSIDIPLSRFHLRPGDALHSVQAFSMTALTDQRTFVSPLVIVDSTPAQTLRIAGPDVLGAATRKPAVPAKKPAAKPVPLAATGVPAAPIGLALALILAAALAAGAAFGTSERR